MSALPATLRGWAVYTHWALPVLRIKPRSTVLTAAEEAIVVESRRRTLLPLDDVLGCLKESIPKLTRSALHRCLVRRGTSRLPKTEDGSSKRKAFKEIEIGYVHVDSCQSARPRASCTCSWPSTW